MINRLRKASQLPAANGISGGFVIDNSSERIKTSVSSAENYARYVRATAQVDISGNVTVTAKDDGKNLVTDTAPSVVSLPKAAAANKGMRIRLTVGGLAASGAGHAFSPHASDFIAGNGLTAVVDKDLICSSGTDRLYDFAELESNGSTGWFLVDLIGTWAKE